MDKKEAELRDVKEKHEAEIAEQKKAADERFAAQEKANAEKINTLNVYHEKAVRIYLLLNIFPIKQPNEIKYVKE